MIVTQVGTHNLLIPVLLSILASLVIILLINRQYRDRVAATHHETEESGAAERSPNPLKSRYILLIFTFAFVATISYYFLDNAFYGLTEIHFPDNDALTGFLGIYFALIALAQLIFKPS